MTSRENDLYDFQHEKLCVNYAEGWGLVIFDWFILNMRMHVILDPSFRPPGFSP